MDTRELIKELVGNVCRCGKQKQQGQTFCRSCYYSLPKPLRTRLYQRIGEGYEEAYQEAIQALQPLPSSPREVMPE